MSLIGQNHPSASFYAHLGLYDQQFVARGIGRDSLARGIAWSVQLPRAKRIEPAWGHD